MAAKKTLNQKRLTKKQVAELIASGATFRGDLADRLAETYASGHRTQPAVYELSGDRFLYVFDPKEPSLGGKGDLYPGDYFRRFVRWVEKVRDDARHGRQSSVAHWDFYSRHKTRLVAAVDALLAQLASDLGLDPSALDRSYPSLDAVSRAVEGLGVERAQETLYDALVAYAGEVLRQRSGGEWRIDALDRCPYPYVRSPARGVLMPINVVWSELSGLEPVDLREAVANEIRRATAKPVFRDGAGPNQPLHLTGPA
jgi:hypothetical protein